MRGSPWFGRRRRRARGAGRQLQAVGLSDDSIAGDAAKSSRDGGGRFALGPECGERHDFLSGPGHDGSFCRNTRQGIIA